MKICKQCGEQVADEVLACPKCGAVLETAEEVAEAAKTVVEEAAPVVEAVQETINMEPAPVLPPNQQVQLEVEPNPGMQKQLKMLIMAGVAVVALLVLVLVGRSLFTTSYKTPLNKAEKLLNKQTDNVEAIIDALMPKFVSNAYDDAIKAVKKFDKATDSETYDGMMENIKSSMEDFYAGLEDEYGKNVKFSYKIKEKEKLSSKDLKEIGENYKSFATVVDSLDKMFDSLKDTFTDKYDMKKKEANDILDVAKKVTEGMKKGLKDAKPTEGYAVTVEIKIKGKDDEDKQEVDINIIKMNGKWCFDILSIDGVSSEINSLIKQLNRGQLPF